MAHSEKVCRVGALALAPIAVIFGTVLFFAAVGGIFWAFVHIFPDAPANHDAAIPVPLIIMLGIAAASLVVLISTGVYPYLYRHCQGAEVLAKFEALDQEGEAIGKAYIEKMADLNRRRTELMISLRGGSSAKAEDV